LSEKLSVLSGKEIVKALAKIGFVPVRQKGSDVFLDIIEQSKLTKEEFPKLLK
jgi:predicted RNA binding protein YcfA (HicA-like mRNA interferase family)